MKKSGLYGITLAAALLMAGCTEDLLDGRRGEVPIYLTATVSEGNGHASTRAGVDIQSTQLPSGTTFAAEFTGNAVTVSSVTYTADGNGGISSVSPSQPYFTLSGTSTTVHAYCPSKPSGTFSVQTNQSDDANYKASDLLYASTDIEKSDPMGALQFSHKMAKLIVNVTAGEGISSITGVYIIGGNRTIAISDDGACTLGATSDALSDNSPLTMYTGSGVSASCAALLPPQTVTGNFLKIMTDCGATTFSLTDKVFATGQSYVYNIVTTVSEIGLTTDVTGWDEQNAQNLYNNGMTSSALQAVDLGLSVKWANMNVGATSVTDYGLYFAWGEIVGRSGDNNGETANDGYSYILPNYKWHKGDFIWGTSEDNWQNTYFFTKYIPTGNTIYYWAGSGDADNKLVLDSSDDAAIANWGRPWRMPTNVELTALKNTYNTNDWGANNDTHWKWTWYDNYNNSGHAGFLISYRADADKTTVTSTLFLPATGHRDYTDVCVQGSNGYYWSSTLYSESPEFAWSLGFDSEWMGYDEGIGRRHYGYAVRPVYDP